MVRCGPGLDADLNVLMAESAVALKAAQAAQAAPAVRAGVLPRPGTEAAIYEFTVPKRALSDAEVERARGAGASYHVSTLLEQIAAVENTLGPERDLAKRFTFDDPDPFAKGTKLYYIEEAEREAQASLAQWSLNSKYTPEEQARLERTRAKVAQLIEDCLVALNDRSLAISLIRNESDLAPHANVFRALRPVRSLPRAAGITPSPPSFSA